MFFKQTIELKQKQELIMTQELRQSIEILQYNSLELKDFLSKEMLENPVLELEESFDDSRVNWDEYVKQDSNSSSYSSYDSDNEEYNIESFIEYKENLYDYLLSQLIMVDTSEEEFEVSDYLISNIDSKGYLKINIEEMNEELKIGKDMIYKCIKIVQSFDPIGVGAFDLRDCLMIQLNYLEVKNDLIVKLVDSYLEDISKNRLVKISNELNVDIQEVQKAVEFISKLSPNPGSGFYEKNISDLKYITADAYVLNIDGKIEVIVEDSVSSRLNISSFYKDILLNSKDEDAKEYLQNRLDKALWVIKSIEQRRQTIKKVVNSIIKHQKEFFIKGKDNINPLTLKEVAEDIQMHESTVSRVTSNKYIETDRGLYELRYFFNSKIEGLDEDISSLDIKSKISKIIKEEDKKKPFSDQKITDILKADGVKISRRTIAKYREELEIPSSTMRKKF